MAYGCLYCAPAARLIARRDAAPPGAVLENLLFSTPGHLRIMVTFQVHSGGY